MKRVRALVHPEAIEALKKYRGDIQAGHTDAAEYWRGQAGAYFTANPILNAETQPQRIAIASYIENQVKAPYVRVEISTLGGLSSASAIIKVSLDDQKDWYNNIFHNSRYFMIRLGNNGSMEMFVNSYRIPKMRTMKVVSLRDAVNRINLYIGKVSKMKNPGAKWHVDRANQLRKSRDRVDHALANENFIAAEESRKLGMNPIPRGLTSLPFHCVTERSLQLYMSMLNRIGIPAKGGVTRTGQYKLLVKDEDEADAIKALGVYTMRNPPKEWHQDRLDKLKFKLSGPGSYNATYYSGKAAEEEDALKYYENPESFTEHLHRISGIPNSYLCRLCDKLHYKGTEIYKEHLGYVKLGSLKYRSEENPFFSDLGAAVPLGAGFGVGSMIVQKIGQKLLGKKRNPITQTEITELVNLYHLAQVAVGYKRYDRLVWAAKEFHKAHPDVGTTQAYKEVDVATRPYLNPRDKEPWQMTKKEWAKLTQAQQTAIPGLPTGASISHTNYHFLQVIQAIRNGLPVPRKVIESFGSLPRFDPRYGLPLGNARSVLEREIRESTHNPRRPGLAPAYEEYPKAGHGTCDKCKQQRDLISFRGWKICKDCFAPATIWGLRDKGSRNPVHMKWDDMHLLAREEIATGAGFRPIIAKKKWNEIGKWIQMDIQDSLKRRSKGKVTVGNNPYATNGQRVIDWVQNKFHR